MPAAETPLLSEAEAVAAMAALAQLQRLRIFRSLVGRGPAGMRPAELALALAMPASTLSFHLKELMQAGLVSQERDGRQLIYRPEIARIDALNAYLSAHCCEGQPCGQAALRPSVCTAC